MPKPTRKWPTLEGRLKHPLDSRLDGLKQMQRNGDTLSLTALEYLEKYENDFPVDLKRENL